MKIKNATDPAKEERNPECIPHRGLVKNAPERTIKAVTHTITTLCIYYIKIIESLVFFFLFLYRHIYIVKKIRLLFFDYSIISIFFYNKILTNISSVIYQGLRKHFF